MNISSAIIVTQMSTHSTQYTPRETLLTLRLFAPHAQAAGDVFLGLLRLGGRLLRAHHVAFERVVFKVDDLGRAALEP